MTSEVPSGHVSCSDYPGGWLQPCIGSWGFTSPAPPGQCGMLRSPVHLSAYFQSPGDPQSADHPALLV